MTLKQSRDRRDAARKLIERGDDPGDLLKPRQAAHRAAMTDKQLPEFLAMLADHPDDAARAAPADADRRSSRRASRRTAG